MDHQTSTPQARIEWELCRRSAHTFIFGLDTPAGRRHFLYTKDEHNSDNVVQPFPDFEYLRVIVDLLLVSGMLQSPEEARYALDWGLSLEHLQHLYATNILAVEKSRQVRISWVVLAYLLWRSKFMDHQLIMVQSKREEDAAKLVCVHKNEPDGARFTFMETHLPAHLRTVDLSNKGTSSKCKIFHRNGSHVWGIPEGGSLIRSHTPSILFSDEAAFQPAFGEAHRAAVPAIRGGGQAIYVSSAEVSEFQNLVEADR